MAIDNRQMPSWGSAATGTGSSGNRVSLLKDSPAWDTIARMFPHAKNVLGNKIVGGGLHGSSPSVGVLGGNRPLGFANPLLRGDPNRPPMVGSPQNTASSAVREMLRQRLGRRFVGHQM